jgi:flagellar biosynthesis protein FlhF
MQVHTFIADSATDAVNRIRSELGPSAVVLSVRKLPRSGLGRFVKQEQIEVLAGIDESPKIASHPAALPFTPPSAPPVTTADSLAEIRAEIQQLRQELAARTELRPAERRAVVETRSPISHPQIKSAKSNISHLLTQTGLLPAFAESILQDLPALDSYTLPEQITAITEILRQRWRGEALPTEAAVHVFVGVPGCGKSTVLCKMLAQTTLLQGQPSTVYQLDSHVANASPLPSVYAEVVGAQFERSAPLQFERREESVYIDLPGVALHHAKGLDQLKDLISIFGVPEIHLILNGAYESSHLLEQVRFFSSLGISGLIITHLDEESRWGKIWNLVLGTNLNVRGFATGQNIPGDFHPANPDVIFSRQFASK